MLVSLFWIPKIKALSKYNLVKDNYENVYYVQNGMPEHYGSDIQFKFTLNGKTAFCMDPIAPITKYEYNGIPLIESIYNKQTQDYLNKVIYYGYDYPGHQTERYYMATQALIWEHISNYVIEFYTERYGYGEYIDVSSEKNEIINLINSNNNLPSFANNHYSYNPTSYLEFEDSNLSDYEIIESNWQNVIIENNKLKIQNLQNFIGKIDIKLKKKEYRNDIPMYYYEDGSQSMISGGKIESIEANLSINIVGAKIQINKLDKNSNLPIKDKNIKFNIINMQTNEYVRINGNKDLSINSDGYLVTGPIPYGEYKITEMESGFEYELNQNEAKILVNEETINENNIYELNFYNALKRGQITITKIDKESKKSLAGIEFGLYATVDITTSDGKVHYVKGELVQTGVTDDKGLLTFKDLVYGHYYIKEEKQLNGYIKDNENYTVDLNRQEYNLLITNELEKGSITIQKYGEIFNTETFNYSLKELENVEFKLIANEDIVAPEGTIYYKKGDIVAIKTTDETGRLDFENLILGDYCFIETRTLNGYEIDNNPNCYDLKNLYGVYVEKINYAKRGHLKLNKLDKVSDIPIKNSNTKFQIKNLDTSQYILIDGSNILEINSDGYLIINNLLYGTYEIKETSTSPIYELNTEPLIIEINDKTINEDNIVEVNFYNTLKKGNINIIKNGEKFNFKTGNYEFISLSGIEFSLYANEDIFSPNLGITYSKGDIIDIQTTNKKGQIKFDNLILGSYCIRETRTNDSYILDNNDYCFNLLDNKNENLELTNYLKKGNIILTKLDKDSKLPIKNSGIQFQIKNLESNRYIYINGNKNLTISDEGYLIINNLPYGTYEIKEASTSNEYLLNKEPKIIELNNLTIENNTLKIDFFNEKKNGQIIVNKKGESYNYKTKKYSYKLLDNIEFSLIAHDDIITKDGVKHYNKNDIVINDVTDVNGQLIFDNLILGKYCLMETKTRYGYLIDKEVYCFDLLSKKSQEITLTNHLKKGNLKIIKIDSSTKEPIKNVTFEIYHDNNYIGKYKTNENGVIELKDIPAINYQIKETKVPNNYILNDKLYTVDLTQKNEIIIENDKKIILPNTKLNDYTPFISAFIIMIGLVLYKYDSKKKKI
ncbi:MAG: Cys-Gln thioester bond-forming surface protein [Bacilli bacterium]|nr:Cys-Gln thioester bond-forming surface protein [Bacilli bacterium]